MDHAERILYRYRLRPGLLQVDIRAAQTRQNEGVTPGHQMAAVELGADLNRERALL